VLDVIAIIMGETLASGSAVIEAVGQEIGVDMTQYWQADDAFFSLLRDREVLGAIVAEVAGHTVASANTGEKAKTLKKIVRDHLDGADGREKVAGWVPRWMRFPPSAYTARGGVGTVAAQERLEAVRQDVTDADLEQDQAPVEPESIAA
jgi:ParB family chromosome partitioning protein